jgi:tetratricopeptide (TPR) repeat protein
VISLLIAEQRRDEALDLCQKIIDWITPLKTVGHQGAFEYNIPNDIRNGIVCRYAELLAKAGAIDKARQTLAEERDSLDSQVRKGLYLQRIAEAQAKIGDKNGARETYIDAISNILAGFAMPYYQDQYFNKVIDSYCHFLKTQGANP